MSLCYFVSDLHGKIDRYEKLFDLLKNSPPDILLMGGDLLPHGIHRSLESDFVQAYLYERFKKLQDQLQQDYPKVLIILGNDDPRTEEQSFSELEKTGVWDYLHYRFIELFEYSFCGYSYVPPTPFMLKDWERFDISHQANPGCIPPDKGVRTVNPGDDFDRITIQQDLEKLCGDKDLSQCIFLFHSPPYNTYLDRAGLDGQTIDGIPLDVHVGSKAIKKLIEERQPLITLHGHIHESSKRTGHWKQQIGKTWAFNASWAGPELSVVQFEMENPVEAKRILF